MPTIRKVLTDITSAYKELKLVLGENDPIIRSMKEYLKEYYTPVQDHLREILDGLPLDDIILCKGDSGRYDVLKYFPESDSTNTGTPLSKVFESSGYPATLPYVPSIDVAITPIQEEVEYSFESYGHLIKWGLWVINNNIPDVFRTGSGEGYYTGAFGIYAFSIEFPNKICIRFHVHEEKDKIFYWMDLSYDHSKAIFFRQSDLYKAAMNNKWEDLYE